MLPCSPTFALALGFLLLASASAGCSSGNTTTGTGGMGTGGAATGGAATGGMGTGGAATGGMGTGGMVPAWDSPCHTCLQDECKDQIAACDSECLAIQACIDSICGNLSKIGAAMMEGQCQVQCQAKHSGAKQKHLDLVNCAQGAGACMPPCKFAIYDWEKCAEGVSAGACKPALDACNASGECQTYVACASACFDNPGCQMCAANDPAGQKIYEAYWQCVETTCITEAWLKQF